MGQFKPMVKMFTTEPSVELKLKKGGHVSMKASKGEHGHKMMDGGVPPVPARGGMAPTASPMKPSLAARRRAMMAMPAAAAPVAPTTGGTFAEGMARFANDPMASIGRHKFLAGSTALAGAMGGREAFESPTDEYDGPLKRFRFNPDTYRPAFYADGGIATLASGGYDRMVGEEPQYPENMASGGISSLGGYSDGGRMLKGAGDGMSDSIPATIGGKRPARLADGEFVVPARIVSELGNGSTEAGAKKLYAMMDRVQKARSKTTGKNKVAANSRADKYLPA